MMVTCIILFRLLYLSSLITLHVMLCSYGVALTFQISKKLING